MSTLLRKNSTARVDLGLQSFLQNSSIPYNTHKKIEGILQKYPNHTRFYIDASKSSAGIGYGVVQNYQTIIRYFLVPYFQILSSSQILYPLYSA